MLTIGTDEPATLKRLTMVRVTISGDTMLTIGTDDSGCPKTTYHGQSDNQRRHDVDYRY